MELHNIVDQLPCRKQTNKQKNGHFNFRGLKEKQMQSKEKKNV